eukprot:GILK01004589.1.p1 GENE.GILK01004589.1~~GILK01004589.1.p1  ORF type:complete len:497 (-),score=63.94 GILK01004589.1:426-1880(-)
MEVNGSALLLCSLFATAVWYVFWYVQTNFAKANEAPMKKALIPFLGSALQYGADSLTFLRRCQQDLGSTFTLLLAGNRMTFVTDPQDVPFVLKDVQRLRFDIVSEEIGQKVTFIPAKVFQTYDHALIHRLFLTHLQGASLRSTASSLYTLIREVLSEVQVDTAWHKHTLYDFMSRTVFKVSTETIFGRGFYTDELYKSFMRFDSGFPLMVAGVPQTLLGKYVESLKFICHSLHTYGSAQSFAPLIQARVDHFKQVGLTDMESERLNATILWAANANTSPAAFWSVAYLLAHPEALQRVREEIKPLFVGSDSADFQLSYDVMNNLPLLDSAINEALRLCTASLTIRQSVADFELNLSEGKSIAVRKGDRVCVAPVLIHTDPEVFQEPLLYKVDRFVPDANGPKKFYKDGKEVRHYLMPFGGGVSMCPGRFMAVTEIKIYVATLLHLFDLRLDAALPPVDQTRAGLGILPPKGDVAVSIRPRMTSR